MGSMLKADSERQALVRERRQARLERKQQRRDARARKRSQIAGPPPARSPIQSPTEQRVDAAVEEIVTEALARHDQHTTTANMPAGAPPAMHPAEAPARVDRRAAPSRPPASSSTGQQTRGPRLANEATSVATKGEHRPRRERDIAAFGERRRQTAEEAREEARKRITRTGELACVTDALAALAHPEARPWESEREQLEQALQGGRIVEVGAVARRSLWAVTRDAARSSRRARRDPDLALAVCVAYAIIARLPRTAVRSAQRTRPAPHPRPVRQRAFWR